MAIKESKLKNGKLTIGGKEFSTQAQNVKITPSYKDDGEPLETLSGDQIASSTTRTDTLTIDAIQDFTDPMGFQTFCWDNDQKEIAFTWTPTSAATPSWSGTLQVRAVEVGGDVNKRISTSAEFPASNVVFTKATAAAAYDLTGN
jgi:hypothetical protein